MPTPIPKAQHPTHLRLVGSEDTEAVARLKAMVAAHDKTRADGNTIRIAASHLGDVYGSAPGRPEIVAAVKLAQKALRDGMGQLEAIRFAAAKSGVERLEIARAILGMRGAP